jgi:hypothetical protein
MMNETVSLRACDYKSCPSVTMTGKDVAKIALVILAIAVILYLVIKA